MNINCIEKMIKDRVTEKYISFDNGNLYDKLYRKTTEEIENLIKDNPSVKDAEKMLEIDLSPYLNKFEPSLEGYIMVKQFKDAVSHILAEYRVEKKVISSY